jgi:hypothetical protein
MVIPSDDVTPCVVTLKHRCTEPGRVVLYALGGEFAGREYQPGQKMVLCLRHGGDVLDARKGGKRAWLAPYLNRLPLVKLSDHHVTHTHAQPAPDDAAKIRQHAINRVETPRQRRRHPYSTA